MNPFHSSGGPKGLGTVEVCPNYALGDGVGVQIENGGSGMHRYTIINLKDVPLAINNDATADYGATKVASFSAASLLAGSYGSARLVVTCATAAGAVNAEVGVGTVAIAAGAVALNTTTHENLIDGASAAFVANVGTFALKSDATNTVIDATGAAADIYVNVAASGPGLVPALAFATISGWIRFSWVDLGNPTVA